MASDQQQHEEPNPNPMMDTFMEITSSTPEEAQFYLESHNFDLDAAVSTFFESNTAEIAAVPTVETADNAADVARSSSPSPSPSRSRSHSPPAAAARSQYNLRNRTTRSGVRTLADLNNDGSGSDGDDDADRPPQYFTGGHKSGMVVEDPSKDNNVDAIFEHARRVGAMEGPADVYQPSSSSRSFAGTARLLSGETVSSSPHEAPPEVVTHTITFWRNGFTVNDGPLRLLDDDDNASFLESIKNSECPKELEPKDRRTKVSVNLTRRDENCPVQEPQRLPIAFQGVGRTLGSTTSAPSESSVLSAAPAPVMGLVVDDKLPSTSIQLRLADGTRMVSRFNHHHTIRDIRGFIDASRPTRGGAYTLQLMGFPPKPLTELDQTIEQAGLSNSVVIQKY